MIFFKIERFWVLMGLSEYKDIFRENNAKKTWTNQEWKTQFCV